MKYIIDCMGNWSVDTLYNKEDDAWAYIARQGSQASFYAVRKIPQNKRDWEELVKESPLYQELIELRELKAYHDRLKKDVKMSVDYEINL